MTCWVDLQVVLLLMVESDHKEPGLAGQTGWSVLA